MKKLIIILVFLAVITPVFAQNSSDDSTTMYYINVPVERIYSCNEGYIVQYRTSTNRYSTIGIPNEWFVGAAGKADIVRLPPGTNWPTMSVFFQDGEFSHVRLYVHRSRSHLTWGIIPQGTDVSRYFEDKDSFDFQF